MRRAWFVLCLFLCVPWWPAPAVARGEEGSIVEAARKVRNLREESLRLRVERSMLKHQRAEQRAAEATEDLATVFKELMIPEVADAINGTLVVARKRAYGKKPRLMLMFDAQKRLFYLQTRGKKERSYRVSEVYYLSDRPNTHEKLPAAARQQSYQPDLTPLEGLTLVDLRKAIPALRDIKSLRRGIVRRINRLETKPKKEIALHERSIRRMKNN